MRPDLLFWVALPVKMAATALFVLAATRAAEMAGPLLGAMVATLPLSAAPAYLFVALDHDTAFVAASALASLAANAANVLFCIVHAVAAQNRGMVASLLLALGAWGAMAVVLHAVDWTLGGAVLLNLAVLALCLPIGNRLRGTPMPAVRRRRYDAVLRAGMVAILVAAVMGASARLGPSATGILALFPVVLVSLVLILQPRIGGPATSSLTANAILGLAGYGAALVTLHIAVVPLGSPAALILALSVSIGWNLLVLLSRRRALAA